MLEHDTPGADAIRFHQIGVIVPDALYEELSAAPRECVRAAASVADEDGQPRSRVESPVREAITLLLRLPLGRFSRDEMLHLLNHPAIGRDDAEWETDQVNRWCEELGIFFGADADDLAGTYIPGNSFIGIRAFGGWHSACSWAPSAIRNRAFIPRLSRSSIYLRRQRRMRCRRWQASSGLRGRCFPMRLRSARSGSHSRSGRGYWAI